MAAAWSRIGRGAQLSLSLSLSRTLYEGGVGVASPAEAASALSRARGQHASSLHSLAARSAAGHLLQPPSRGIVTTAARLHPAASAAVAAELSDAETRENEAVAAPPRQMPSLGPTPQTTGTSPCSPEQEAVVLSPRRRIAPPVLEQPAARSAAEQAELRGAAARVHHHPAHQVHGTLPPMDQKRPSSSLSSSSSLWASGRAGTEIGPRAVPRPTPRHGGLDRHGTVAHGPSVPVLYRAVPDRPVAQL